MQVGHGDAQEATTPSADGIELLVEETNVGIRMTGKETMRLEPEVSAVSVVLLGSFNPAIFTPAWFALNHLLPESAAENVVPEVVHAQFSAFSTEWLRVQVIPDRFQAESRSAPLIRVRDIVLRIFREQLFHTPVSAVGINREIHFRVASVAARDRVGRLLAPVEPWEKIADKLELDKDQSGMVSLTMRQSQPEGRPPGGHINVTVEPSVRMGEGGPGICVRINDHFQGDTPTTGGQAELLGMLEGEFEASIRRADEIVDHVMSLAANS